MGKIWPGGSMHHAVRPAATAASMGKTPTAAHPKPTGLAWLALYVILSLAPLMIVWVDAPARQDASGRGFVVEFSVALGFVGLAMMCLQFALTGRFKRLKAPFGSDIVYAFHRGISLVSVLLILSHPLLLLWVRPDDMLRRLNPLTAPPPALLGLGALAALLVLVIVSMWRRRLGVEYNWWRRTHAVLGTLAVLLAIGHIVLIDHYMSTPVQRGLWLAYALAFVGLIAYTRLIKPWMELRRPWHVVRVTPERGQCWSVTLAPKGHAGFAYAPGQFAWITLFSSPFADNEHAFSMSSAPANAVRRVPGEAPGAITFTIKARGDFTRRVPSAQAGMVAYVDGPFGVLSAERFAGARAYVFIAGGIGITPMMSHVRAASALTSSDGNPQAWMQMPLVLIYGSKDWENTTFREELLEHAARLPNLRVIFVLGTLPEEQRMPDLPAGVEIVSGIVSRALLQRVLTPFDIREVECFLCGPDPMMDACEEHLWSLGVPLLQVHAERFDLA